MLADAARVRLAIRLRLRDMPIRLPFSSLLVPVRQIAARVRRSKLARYSAAVVLLPLKPSRRGLGGAAARRAAARAVRAQGPQGRRLLPAARGRARRDAARRRLPARAGEHLRAAASRGQARARGAGVRARSRSCCGSRAATASRADAALHAAVAAIQAAAFRLATFKSKPKPRTALARIDIALARQAGRPRAHARLVGGQQSRPLAHRAAAEHARRRGLPPPAQGSRAALAPRVIEFYGESAAASASAPARFSPSRRAMPRAMPASCASPTGRAAPARAGGEPRGQGHLLRHRRHQLEAAQEHARHAHRHGGQRGGASAACMRCTRCARRSRSTAGWRSPRTASARSPTSRRTWCAPTTARPFR